MATESPWGSETQWEPVEGLSCEYTRTTEDFTGDCIHSLPPQYPNTGIPFYKLPADVQTEFRRTACDFTPIEEVNSNFAELLEKPSNSDLNAYIQNHRIFDAIIELFASTYSNLYDEIFENTDINQNYHTVSANLSGQHKIRVDFTMYYVAIGSNCYDINLQIVLTHNEFNHYILLDTTRSYYSALSTQQ